MSGRDDEAPATRDRVFSMYGSRFMPALGERLGELGGELVKQGALALLLLDAAPLLQIERLYGARALRGTLESLTRRVRARVEREFGEKMIVTSGSLHEEHLLIFLPRPRTETDFFLHELPRLAEELRAWTVTGLKRIVYPYLAQAPEIPIGCEFALHRPHQRPEAQIRRLIEQTLAGASFAMERKRRDRAAMLERILLEEKVSTVFEPIVRLASNEVIGFEALTRGPSGSGLESPFELFSAAEASDREYELDSLCRRRALANARGIRSDQLLFLNILPSSIQDPDFQAARVRETLDTLGLSPRNLVLEISEKQAISNFPIMREAIDHFTGLGFGIALDDTGSGFSSLQAALELAPDFLKLDMSLVRSIEESPEKQELLRGLQSLASKMGSRVIAEGIETEHELAAIRALGIECGQGFHLGRGSSSPGAPAPEGGESR